MPGSLPLATDVSLADRGPSQLEWRMGEVRPSDVPGPLRIGVSSARMHAPRGPPAGAQWESALSCTTGQSAAACPVPATKSSFRIALIIGSQFNDFLRRPEFVQHPSTRVSVNWGHTARRVTLSFPKSTFSMKPGMVKVFFFFLKKSLPRGARVGWNTPPMC